MMCETAHQRTITGAVSESRGVAVLLHGKPFWWHKTAQSCFQPEDSPRGATCSHRAHPVPADTARPVYSRPSALQAESAEGRVNLRSAMHIGLISNLGLL